MARYAVVQSSNEIVVNVVEWDGNTATWQPPAGTTAVASATAQIGDTYNPATGVFTPPLPPSLAQVKAQADEKIKIDTNAYVELHYSPSVQALIANNLSKAYDSQDEPAIEYFEKQPKWVYEVGVYADATLSLVNAATSTTGVKNVMDSFNLTAFDALDPHTNPLGGVGLALGITLWGI